MEEGRTGREVAGLARAEAMYKETLELRAQRLPVKTKGKKKVKMIRGVWDRLLRIRKASCSILITPGILSSQDGPVLGAVGSFSWSGGAFLYSQNMKPTFINMSQDNVDMRDSYLGKKRLWEETGWDQLPEAGGALVLRSGPLRLLHRTGLSEGGPQPGPGGPSPPAHGEGCHLYPGMRTVEAQD